MEAVATHAGRGESPVRRQISRIISESLIDPVFQPIIDIQRAHFAGFESLSRPRAGSGFENAGELFDAADACGMLWSLEEVTRRVAFAAVADRPPAELLFMNCSPGVFADPRFAEVVQESVLNTPGLTPGRVVLEITERSEPEHIESLSRQVALLKEQGFQIAIDDVGAGTSGLNRIMRLRPHWLKLDRDLVESIDRDRVKQNLMRFLVHFARISGVRVVAEGVERSEELAALMDLGVVYAQGYYLGRPGSRDQTLGSEVAQWLRQSWGEVQSCRLSRPQGQQLSSLHRPAIAIEGRTPVADVASEFRAKDYLPGAVVVEGMRCVGWADRDWVLERSLSDQAGCPIAAILPTGSIVLSPEDAITDAVDQLGTRDGRSAHQPVILFESGRVRGIVLITDILCALAEMTRNPLVRTTPITGMPGRVRADEHIATLIAQTAGTSALRRHDAALIDIRHFADYNGAYGYELGDQLLQELASAIRVELIRGDQGTFVAHLGDDRFLITAPAGVLCRRFHDLTERFEQSVISLSASLVVAPVGQNAGTGVGLRIVFISNAASRIDEPRDLYRLAARLRQESESHPRLRSRLSGHSELIVEPPLTLKLSA